MFDRRTFAPNPMADRALVSASAIADLLADIGRSDLLADLLALHADAQAFRALVAN